MRWLVTGLPRSRTAWFALATGAKHEPISHLGYRKFRWADGTGVSDSGAALYLRDIVREVSPRTLIVERPVGEVITSFLAYAQGVDVNRMVLARSLHSMREQLAKVESPLIKRVAYRDLDDLTVMRACMAWLGVDPPNLEDLMHFNVQSQLSWNLEMLKKRAA